MFELWEGVARSKRPRDETERILSFVESHDVLPFNDGDAREAGLLSGRLSRMGRRMGTVDIHIAGMAKSRGEPVLTADRRFKDLASEIGLEPYP